MAGRGGGGHKGLAFGVVAAMGGAGLFVVLLVVGTYSAAASLAGNQQGLGLAPHVVPAVYQPLVEKWGTKCPTLSRPLLAAQISAESGFRPTARSAYAEGIAQFTPDTWATHGVDGNGDGKRDIWDPEDAIPSMAQYDCDLAKWVRNLPGDQVDNMLAAYNAGVYAVNQYRGVPPYAETQGYVKRIRKLAESFAAPPAQVATSGQAAGAIYYAQSKLGTPYLWGGTGTSSEGGRFDCSGLTQAAYKSVGITLPRVANDQWNAGPHPSRSQLKPGDLVFFATDLSDPRSIHHVGMYVGGGYMINAPHTGAVIRFDPINEADYFGATRVTAEGAAALPGNA